MSTIYKTIIYKKAQQYIDFGIVSEKNVEEKRQNNYRSLTFEPQKSRLHLLHNNETIQCINK